MEPRPLGRTGLKVTPVALGCMLFGWKTDQAQAEALVAAALDAGVLLFDTSDSYGRGASERVLGQALKASGRRQRALVATKAHFPIRDDDPNARGNSRRHLIEACEASLKRLGSDWIDLYQVHEPDPETPIDETLRALDDLIRAGKVRAIGTSSFAAWQLVDALWAAKEHGLNRFSVEQPPYNLLDRRAEWEVFPAARAHGLGILAWSPLAEGILAGRYRRGQPLPPDSRFARVTKPGPHAARLTEAVFDMVETLERLAAERGVSPARLALAWVLGNPAVSAALAAPGDLEQLADCVAAAEVTLSAAELAALDAVNPPAGCLSSYYKSDFSPCRYRW